MPSRPRFRRRRRFRRKFSRKKSRSIFHRKFTGVNAKRYFKLKAVFTLTSTAGGTYAGVFTDNPSGMQDWTPFQSLFDSYRVHAIKIRFIPAFPNNLSATTAYRPVYIVGDNDDVGALASVNLALQYDSVKVKNLNMPWTYYFKWSKITSSAAATVMTRVGYLTTATPQANRAVKFYADNLTASVNYGDLVVTMYVSGVDRQ